MAQEKIKLTKTIYGAKASNELINNSFSELATSTNREEDIRKFFNLYNEIFFNLPKNGDKSHTALIIQSTDYVENFTDPRDAQIESLLDRVLELEDELLDVIENEHPIFRNGSFIRTPNTAIYFMQQGKARPVGNMDVYTTIATAQGYDIDAEPFTEVQASTPAEIGIGIPINTESDLSNQDAIVKRSTATFLDVVTGLRDIRVNENQLTELKLIMSKKRTARFEGLEPITEGIRV